MANMVYDYNMNSFIDILACPICGTQFILQQTTLVCANSHAFDVAREGYVNLLRKKLPGDTREMLQARRHFFDEGYYQPVSATVNNLVKVYAPSLLAEDAQSSPAVRVLDAGCGEGYYLGRLYADLASQGEPPLCLGIDIAKDATRLAAKRYAGVHFLVANLKERLPLLDSTLQVLLNIFAPRNTEEYARVLAPGALLLVVIPGPAHLRQLRTSLHLLNIEESKQEHVIAQFADHFSLLTTRTLSYTLRLRKPDITLLVMMTPNYWHLSPESRASLEELEEIEARVEVRCLLFRRQGKNGSSRIFLLL